MPRWSHACVIAACVIANVLECKGLECRRFDVPKWACLSKHLHHADMAMSSGNDICKHNLYCHAQLAGTASLCQRSWSQSLWLPAVFPEASDASIARPLTPHTLSSCAIRKDRHLADDQQQWTVKEGVHAAQLTPKTLTELVMVSSHQAAQHFGVTDSTW